MKGIFLLVVDKSGIPGLIRRCDATILTRMTSDVALRFPLALVKGMSALRAEGICGKKGQMLHELPSG